MWPTLRFAHQINTDDVFGTHRDTGHSP
jgi:hypothetical protein